MLTVQFTLRNFHQADFSTLLHIDQSCFPPGISYTSQELTSYISRRGTFTLIAESAADVESSRSADRKSGNRKIVGFIVTEQSRGVGHIITIDVLQEARRHRIGSALLNAAASELRKRDCSLVRLETAVDNTAALTFYKRHGYHVVKTIPRYYSNGVDALLLEKNLHSPQRTS